jgi:hypothetical protein
MRNILIPLALAAFGSTAVVGSTAEPAVRTLAKSQVAAPAKLADFQSLVGQWVGPKAQVAFSAPMNGQIVGYLAIWNDDRSPSIEELWVLRQEGEHVTVQQKHFGPNLKAYEEKDQWGQRGVVAIEQDHIYLDNVTWITHGNDLQLLVRIPGADGKAAPPFSVSFKRAK